MLSRTRISVISLAVITVLVLSAIGPTIVYADDSAPTSPQPTETSGNGSGGVADPQPTTTEEPVVGEATPAPADQPPPSATEEPVVDGATPAPADSNSDGQTQSTESVPPIVDGATPPADPGILAQVPDNTTVTVLNTDGQPEPLATQDAADAIATTTDPIWCPATQTTPTPGSNGCTASFTSFDALLTELSGNTTYQGAGTIYIEQNTYGGGESSIDFNTYDLSNISSSDLTLQGGWNTATNTVDPASTSNFTVPIIIGSSASPWGGSLTINNIVINNANTTALTLHSQNNINLSNVQVTNSVTGSGAELNAGGDVTINNSTFDRNRKAGAVIKAGGNVAIANSTFSNPGSNRLQITGLDIFTTGGSVSFFNLQAIGNREVGANINATGRVSISTSIFSGTKAFTTGPGGTITYYGYGLQVVTPDSIDLDTVTANDNFLWGASLDADQNVTIANSVFNGNTTASTAFIDDTGLLVKSGGQVSLNNVQANDNRLIGAVIDAVGTVSLNNSTFTNNKGITISGGVTTYHGLGLQVTSLDSIFLNNVTASNNTLFGAHLGAGGDVAISNSTFSNNASGSATDPFGNGLEVISAGNVFLDTVLFDNNQLTGADLQATSDVFLDNITATNNGVDGVAVQANCTNLNGGTYSGNGQYGLNLINSPLNQIVPPVFANNSVGDIFPLVPGACIVVANSGNSSNPSQFASQVFGGTNTSHPLPYGILRSGSASRFDRVRSDFLNDLLARFPETTSGTNATLSIFTGKYIYVYSAYGMQIVSLYPVSLSDVKTNHGY